MWFWHPSKEEIENSIEVEEKEFVEKENEFPRPSAEDWLQRYIFTDLHEIFFSIFPSDLYSWLSRLEENETSICSDRHAEWTLEVIQRLKRKDNSIS